MIIIHSMNRLSPREFVMTIIVGTIAYDVKGIIHEHHTEFEPWLDDFITLCGINWSFNRELYKFIEGTPVDFPLKYDTKLMNIEIEVFNQLKSGVSLRSIIKQYLIKRPNIV
jgi:hypothetical protein